MDAAAITSEPPTAIDSPKPEPIAGPSNLGAILSIPVTVQVVLGSTSLPVSGLMKLARGAIVSLDQRVGDPVDVVVNGTVIARGEIVVVDDSSQRFGVSLLEVVAGGGLKTADEGSAGDAAMLEAAISGERVLTGPEKAAALLLMMGKPPAARLLKQFDQPDLQAVARAAAGLGAIPATTLDRLVDEFAADFSAGADLFGDAGQVKNLLADTPAA